MRHSQPTLLSNKSNSQGNGLICHLPLTTGGGNFEQDIASGNYNGTLNGTLSRTVTQLGKGVSNTAALSNGKYITVPITPTQLGSSYTFSVRCCPTSNAGTLMILSRAFNYGNPRFLLHWNPTASAWSLWVNSVEHGAFSMTANKVYTVTIVYDGQYNVYLNGVFQVASTNASVDALVTGVWLTYFSVLSYNSSHSFPGAVSDFRIYNRALSVADIQDIHYNPEKVYYRKPLILTYLPPNQFSYINTVPWSSINSMNAQAVANIYKINGLAV